MRAGACWGAWLALAVASAPSDSDVTVQNVKLSPAKAAQTDDAIYYGQQHGVVEAGH